MQIRIRATGQVMYESEFRMYIRGTSGASWGQTTPEVLEALEADPVFEGAQATGEFWQYSQYAGVEQIDGKWYTKYTLGPVFTDTDDATAAEQEAEYVATKTAQRAAELQNSVVQQTQRRLDAFAQTRNYDSILSACTYASSTLTKFADEGQYCVQARDETWAALYEILADVQAGTRPVPTSFAEIEEELPTLAWPE
jgi:hypothetical protein